MGGVTDDPCPRCGGTIHVENFVGHAGNTNAYSQVICIGDVDLPQGADGASFSGNGCGFRAEKRWDSENPEETVETDDAWEEWQEARSDDA